MRLDRTRQAQRVLDALRAGEMTSPELQGRLGLSNKHLHNVLRRLVDDGRVTQTSPSHGKVPASWALTRERGSAADLRRKVQ